MRFEDVSLTNAEIRRVFAVIDGCRECWADRTGWQRALLRGIAQLTRSPSSAVVLAPLAPDGVEREMHVICKAGCGDAPSDGCYRAVVAAFREAGLGELCTSPATELDCGAICVTRCSLFCDEASWESELGREIAESFGPEEFALAARTAPVLNGVVLFAAGRPPGATAIDAREVRQLAVLAEEVIPRLGCELTLEGQVGLEGLTPRQRETLDLLMEGLSEKQVARSLGIRQPTVHDYVVRLHRHFRVSSRAELLSYFIRRRPRG